MPNKDQVAQLLADAHREVDPSIIRIVRLVSDLENDGREPAAASPPAGGIIQTVQPIHTQEPELSVTPLV